MQTWMATTCRRVCWYSLRATCPRQAACICRAALCCLQHNSREVLYCRQTCTLLAAAIPASLCHVTPASTAPLQQRSIRSSPCVVPQGCMKLIVLRLT